MDTSTNESYQKFLLGIAQQVDSLLIEDSGAIDRFRQHLKNFADKENKHLKWLNKKRNECQRKGEVFSISSDMKVPTEHETPARMFVIDIANKNYPAPKNEAEEYKRCYILLASIHDHILTQVEPIDKGILPELAAGLIWSTLHEFWDKLEQRAFIEQAFKRVQADLASLKAQEKTGQMGDAKQTTQETKPDSTSAQNIHIQNFKGIFGDVQAENVQTGGKSLIHKHNEIEKKKKGILRRIPYWIYILTLFFAGLFTCLSLLRLLEPIRVFVYGLFTNK